VTITLASIRDCLEGTIPSALATCAADGTPNVSLVSQVHYVDEGHVALSFQFFNKTRENVLGNRRASAQVLHPRTTAHYQIDMEYLRTETSGPLFESMKAKLASIASHEGMTGVFKLLGSDVYRVLGIRQVRPHVLPLPAPRLSLLAALRATSAAMAGAGDLDSLLEACFGGLEHQFSIKHAMVLLLDDDQRRLYAVATRGYAESGVGAEILLGQGVIGMAARERTAIRITHMTKDYLYGRAIRESLRQSPQAAMLETEIPLPGLAECRSQLAVPIQRGDVLVGVLYVESPEEGRFSFDDEDALASLAAQFALAMKSFPPPSETPDEAMPPPGLPPQTQALVTIRHYTADDSIFIAGEYLIKGVAGAILWKLLSDVVERCRTEFTNRELRLDPAIRLPEMSENLEARLILLQRRLAERCDFLGIEKTGRGRFRMRVARPVQLVEIDAKG